MEGYRDPGFLHGSCALLVQRVALGVVAMGVLNTAGGSKQRGKCCLQTLARNYCTRRLIWVRCFHRGATYRSYVGAEGRRASAAALGAWGRLRWCDHKQANDELVSIWVIAPVAKYACSTIVSIYFRSREKRWCCVSPAALS